VGCGPSQRRRSADCCTRRKEGAPGDSDGAAREKFESQSPFPITLWEAKRKRKEKCSCAVGFSANRSASRIAREHVYSARSGAVCAPVTTERKKSAFKVRAPLGLLRRDSLRQLSPDWRRSAPRKVRSAADKLGGRKAGRTKPAAKRRSRGTRAFRLACQAEAQKTTNACWAANGTPWAPLKCLATLLSNAHIAPHITEKTMHDAELPPRSLAPCCPRNNPSLGRSQRIRRCTGGQCRLCSACKIGDEENPSRCMNDHCAEKYHRSTHRSLVAELVEREYVPDKEALVVPCRDDLLAVR